MKGGQKSKLSGVELPDHQGIHKAMDNAYIVSQKASNMRIVCPNSECL